MTQPVSALSSPAAKQTSPVPSRVLMGIAVLISAVFWLGVFLQLANLAPLTQKLLLDYKARIPWFTERVMVDFWWLAPAIMVATFLACIAIRKKWAWDFALLVLPLLMNLVVCLSLFIPTLLMLRGLSDRLAGQ